MDKRLWSLVLLLLLVGCGSISDAYVQERLAEEDLTVTSIHALASDEKVAFVEGSFEGIDEEGCVYLWGEDGNTGFSRFTNHRPIDPQAPSLIFGTFNTSIFRTNIICILIQDQTLQDHIASVDITYPSGTYRKAIKTGQSQYVLTVPRGSNDMVLEKVTFFDAHGRILHTQVGETP